MPSGNTVTDFTTKDQPSRIKGSGSTDTPVCAVSEEAKSSRAENAEALSLSGANLVHPRMEFS